MVEVDEDGGVAADHDNEGEPGQADHPHNPPQVHLFTLPTDGLSQVLPDVYLHSTASI